MADLPHIQDAEDILHLSLTQLRSLAKNWQVDLSGAKTKDDLEQRIIKMWLKLRPPNEPEPPDLAGAFKKHELVRQKLYDKYRVAEKIYGAFANKIKNNLEQSHTGVQRIFKERKESLSSGECTIVIVGEVGAGKSSLLNLILETQLFPSDSLKCTNTIIEIRCSDKKDAIFYYKPQLSDSGERERKIPPKIISLKSLTGIQEFKDCVAENDQSDDNPYDRCEVFYPFRTLSQGVVIVDTPGIEGGSNVDQRLLSYLSTAFGFVYVINTNTAGGVQQGRLGHLLKTVVNNCEDFSPEASLFIGNKWENVPEKDKVDVQNDVYQKLNQVYPGIKTDQIHYMSVKKSAEFSMNFKIKLREHKTLLGKVAKLVPSSLRQGMLSHYWWLSSFLSRAAYLLRVTSVQSKMSKEELEKQHAALIGRIDNLTKKTEESIKKLKHKIDFEIYKITQAIQNVLQDKEFVTRICDWNEPGECPAPERRWKNTVDVSAVKISERIAKELDSWDKKNGVIKRIDNEILDVFSRELGLMDDQVKELEDMLSSSRKGNLGMLNTFRVVPVKALFAKKKKKKIERTYNTIGGAVSVIGMLDTDKRDVRRIFRSGYDSRTKCSKMAEATIMYLHSILDNKDFAAKLKKFFERFFKDIDEAANKIPGFLKADQQLIETIRENMKQEEKLKETLPTLVSETSELLGGLDTFYVNRIMKFDYELSELDYDNKVQLGVGAFAIVYKCKFKRHKQTPVALKVSRDDVAEKNVTEILTEDRIMRCLRHPNVVRYYGASYERTSVSVKWIMVMELCSKTLKEIYTGERKQKVCPGLIDTSDRGHAEAARFVLDHASQLLEGLSYIHHIGYTHRDLKLENVLVTDDNIVKITDVGVTKATNTLTSTLVGSPAYMAPEVLTSSNKHTNKMDIYSFSCMFWEMWFGKDVGDEMNQEILGHEFVGDAIRQLKECIAKDGGWRPRMSSPKRPPDPIVEILKRGWSLEPEQRPSAKEFGAVLKTFLQNNMK